MHVTFPYFKEICWRGWRRNLCLKCRAAIAAVIFEWAAKTHSLLCFSCCLHLLLFAKLPSFLPSTEQVAIQHVSYLKIYGPCIHAWNPRYVLKISCVRPLFLRWPIVNRSVGAELAAFVFLSIFTVVLNVSSYF